MGTTDINKAECYDCKLEYGGPAWIEAIVPDKIWNRIKPEGYDDDCGLLCITCISKRLTENGLEDIPVWLCGCEPLIAYPGDSGNFYPLLREFDVVPSGGRLE